MATPEKSSMGPLIGAGIVLLLLLAGGWYFLNNRMADAPPSNTPVILGDGTEALPPTSQSDDLAAIEADINATDLETWESSVEADLRAAESQMQ
jgi:hypothetical protein